MICPKGDFGQRGTPVYLLQKKHIVRKWIFSVIVFFVALELMAASGFFVGIALAGPHADLLPDALRGPARSLIWAAMLGVPIWLGYKTFLKVSGGEKGT